MNHTRRISAPKICITSSTTTNTACSQTTSHQPDINHVQPAATCSSPQGSSWTRMVVVPLPWLRRRLGIHCRMNCETRISTVPPSVATWRRFCFNNTGCIEALCDYALHKSTFTLHLHLWTTKKYKYTKIMFFQCRLQKPINSIIIEFSTGCPGRICHKRYIFHFT